MIYLAQYVLRAWMITDFAAIVPLANQIAGLAVVRPVRPEACPGLDYGR